MFDAVCYNAGIARNTEAKEILRTKQGFELTVGKSGSRCSLYTIVVFFALNIAVLIKQLLSKRNEPFGPFLLESCNLAPDQRKRQDSRYCIWSP